MSDDQEIPYVVVEKRGGGLGSFLLGAVVGAVAGLLFAPKSGKETQQDLREGAMKLTVDAENRLHDLRDDAADVYEQAREDVSDRVERARREMRERARQAQRAVRAGRDAARSARSDLEERVAESKRAYEEAVASDEDADAPDEQGGGERREGEADGS